MGILKRRVLCVIFYAFEFFSRILQQINGFFFVLLETHPIFVRGCLFAIVGQVVAVTASLVTLVLFD